MAEARDGNEPMNVLLIGGAGHVGSILRPALEAAHKVHHFDLQPVPGAEDRTTIASVTDHDAVKEAVAGRDAVVYLAMGDARKQHDHQPSFDVNVQGVYLALRMALKAGVPRFIYTSSLSVYHLESLPKPADEDAEPNNWSTYGVTKRLGEHVCEIAGRRYPEATITALRLMLPFDDRRWERHQAGTSKRGKGYCPTGPQDIQRLYLAALALDKPGVHIVQATGDIKGERFKHDRVTELLGWAPRGE